MSDIEPGSYDENFDELFKPSSNWFLAQLVKLYAKADVGNRARLGKVYPYMAFLFERWFEGRPPYDRHGKHVGFKDAKERTAFLLAKTLATGITQDEVVEYQRLLTEAQELEP